MPRVHTLAVLVEDRPGVLNRVVNLFRRRNFNIESLTVGHSETPNLSRMTISVDGSHDVEQVVKQLYRLIEVVKVHELGENEVLSAELVLVKVYATAQTRAEIMQLCEIYKAKIVDVAPDSLIIEMTGEENKVDSFIALLRPFGLKELVRSGRIAMARGSANPLQVEEVAAPNGTAMRSRRN